MTSDTRFEDRLLAEILDQYEELVAPAPTPLSLAARRHRNLRRAVPALAGAAVAAAAVLAVADTGGSAPHHGGHRPIHVSVAARHGHAGGGPHAVLYRLAANAKDVPAPGGRYIALTESDTDSGEPGQVSSRTSVDDTQTGASITYQVPYADTGAPGQLSEGPDPQNTAAHYASLPTDPSALRTQLLALAKRQRTQALAFFERQAKQQGMTKPGLQHQPQVSDDDLVYEEADDMLWSPVVGPQLRSALYQVLAGCSGYTVDQHATDPSGRPAIAMTHTTTIDNTLEAEITYENPQTGAVLAQTWKVDSDTTTAVYQPVTSSDTMPGDPYDN
jgi:hypothetical protein